MKLVKHTEPTFIFIADEPYQVLDLLMSEIWNPAWQETTGEDMPKLQEYFHHLSTTERIRELLATPAGQDYSCPGIDFIDFLVANRAYEAFIHNMGGKSIQDLMNNTLPELYVAEAFVWDKYHTPEGSEYWSEIDDLWSQEAGFA